MKTFIRNLSKDEIRRLLFLKKEYKFTFLKSIRKNHQLPNLTRFYSQYLLQQEHTFFSKQLNLCKKTGKAGGVYKFSNYSRHYINKQAQRGFLTNIRTNNEK
jgi:ribosomal protein S14